MTNEEKYIMFLEERIKTATSIRSNSAYGVALSYFKQIFGIPETTPPSEGIERTTSEENY